MCMFCMHVTVLYVLHACYSAVRFECTLHCCTIRMHITLLYDSNARYTAVCLECMKKRAMQVGVDIDIGCCVLKRLHGGQKWSVRVEGPANIVHTCAG